MYLLKGVKKHGVDILNFPNLIRETRGGSVKKCPVTTVLNSLN